MLTLFAVPKSFRGHTGIIQLNALRSWRKILPDAQILLLGDDEGVAQLARAEGIEHVAGVAVSEWGTPLLSDVFRRAHDLARFPRMAYVNADIVLLGDFRDAVGRLPSGSVLMVGQSREVGIDSPISFTDGHTEQDLVEQWRSAPSRGPFALDYFVFSRDLFRDLPPFVVGRARFDNWLVWSALNQHAVVMDASDVVRSIHQSHGHQHIPGHPRERRPLGGQESRHNQRLAGWGCYLHLRGVYDCTHTLTPDDIVTRPHLRAAFLRQFLLRAWLKLRGR